MFIKHYQASKPRKPLSEYREEHPKDFLQTVRAFLCANGIILHIFVLYFVQRKKRDKFEFAEETMLRIKIANIDDYIIVRDFYYSLIDAMENAEFKPGWEKDVYPTQEFLIKSIECDELYIGESDGQVVACMVVNHEYNDGYNSIQWSIEATDLELFVIHALGVHPAFSGKGIAKQMVQKVIELARENDIKTIRLDVLGGNVPAERAYIKMGFKYLDTIQMFYEDTGWTDFKVFEYII